MIIVTRTPSLPQPGTCTYSTSIVETLCRFPVYYVFSWYIRLMWKFSDLITLSQHGPKQYRRNFSIQECERKKCMIWENTTYFASRVRKISHIMLSVSCTKFYRDEGSICCVWNLYVNQVELRAIANCFEVVSLQYIADFCYHSKHCHRQHMWERHWKIHVAMSDMGIFIRCRKKMFQCIGSYSNSEFDGISTFIYISTLKNHWINLIQFWAIRYPLEQIFKYVRVHVAENEHGHRHGHGHINMDMDMDTRHGIDMAIPIFF